MWRSYREGMMFESGSSRKGADEDSGKLRVLLCVKRIERESPYEEKP